MKKHISILLIVSLTLSLLSLFEAPLFASSQTSFDKNTSCSSAGSNQAAYNSPSITPNEAAQSFIEKISSKNNTIEESVLSAFGTEFNISDELSQKDRFSIIDIAYENSIIDKEQQITAYCNVIENELFENLHCLHSVIAVLSNYTLSENASQHLIDRISSFLTPPHVHIATALSYETNTTESAQTPSFLNPDIEYSSATSLNFIVYYPSNSSIIRLVAQQVAMHLESLRTQYITEMGFSEPILDPENTRYPIVLNPDSLMAFDGATWPLVSYGISTSTYIELYEFSSFTSEIEEILAHEYFHAIQGAYCWATSNFWFDEATATWGTIITQDESTAYNTMIQIYLNSTLSINNENSNGYGVALFPLSIQSTCETSNAIREIWEEYGNQSSNNLTFAQLKQSVIDTALAPYNQTFNSAFLTMGYYNFSPSTWYSSVHPGGSTSTSAWVERITTTTTTQPNHRNTNFINVAQTVNNETVTQFNLNSYSHNYHKFTPNVTNQSSKLIVQVSFSGTDAANGRARFYYVKTDGTHGVTEMTQLAPYTYTATTDQYGGNYSWCGVIVSNISDDSSISYTISYKVELGSEDSHLINYASGYYERTVSLVAGEYHDFKILSVTAGNRIIQTFGTKDTYIQLYDNNGNLLASNNDSGYSTNGLISYNLSARTYYRIRVTFYSASNSGDVKLSILTAPAVSTYEAFTTYSNRSAALSFNYTQYNVMPMLLKYTTEQNKTLQLTTGLNTVFYIIDPRATVTCVNPSTTDPDSTKALPCLKTSILANNSGQITKTFKVNVSYLVIACPTNLSTVNGETGTVSFS